MQFGIIVLTTSAGIMTHEEARHRKLGGKVRSCSASPHRGHTCRSHYGEAQGAGSQFVTYVTTKRMASSWQ